jgi:hypothetical protein
MARPTKSQQEQELLGEAKTRYQQAEGADARNRERMVEDLKFCYEEGAQWEATVQTRRQGRPCYTYNRTVLAVNEVTGEQRQSRFTGKVSAVNKQSAAQTAELFSGLIRDIEARSNASRIYDQQFKYAVAGGYGAWRILPVYCDEDSFDQELMILDIPNPLTALWDPTATDPCRRDAKWSFVGERMHKDVFREEYPKVEPTSIEITRDNKGWASKDDVRIAEYYKQIIEPKTIVQLSDGRVMDYEVVKKVEEEIAGSDAPRGPLKIERRRDVLAKRVRWYKLCGSAILEGPIDYRWKFIPVIRVPGRFVNIEGEQKLQSLIRHSKDAQRTYNYHRSTMVELAALTPRAPYIGTAKMFKGYEEEWARANVTNQPYLRYDADPDAPNGKPTREPPPDVPTALIALAAQDAEDIRATTGHYNPALNQNEAGQPESGRALMTRGSRADSGSYEFIDNLAEAVKFTWECCVDMLPTVIDTERVVRTIGLEGAQEYVTVNQHQPDGSVVNQLAKGRYDVAITIGPAFATQRQENVSTLLDASERMPIIAETSPDLIVRNLDVQGAAEIEKRIRKRLIMQGVVEPTEEEAAEMPLPQPDPVQEALVKRLAAETAKDIASAQKAAAEAQMAPMELEAKIEDIIAKRLENLKLAGEMTIAGNGAMARVSAQRRAVTDGSPQT